MSNFLQKHLEETCNKQENLKLLKSQWDFDHKLIPKALQSFGQLFPHYSRHDQSHSDQILVNIERILGKNRIEKLTATDTWMLLEAAYWHDLGMVVPNQALEDALQDTDFQSYLLQVASDNGNELHSFAISFQKAPDLTQCFIGADYPLDAVIKFRLLMAEWFRRKHPTRSEKAMNDPWNELGLSSPRTELIPTRLFRLLGRICALHGSDFQTILNQLPHKEVGMANDDCHPRFIACLLRLGDLLDLDDNRFCPVMQRIAGENRPKLSKAHEDKHSSIRHFRLDSERIEISAICETVDGYVEQWHWLDMLRDEMQHQMARWQDIAPSADLGLLPMLGDIKVDIVGRSLVAEKGNRPEFTLNANRVMDLLKGDNLYERLDTVRELLQNAVDATLLRIWESDRETVEKLISEGRLGILPSELLAKYPITIHLNQLGNQKLNDADDQIEWLLTITDQGTGISQSDLQYITNVAGSANNSKRKMLINSMPEWLQPSGTFGIGLQSAFMWSEQISIKTKSLYTQESLDVKLHSPIGPKKGLVEIEVIDDYKRKVGTSLTISIKTTVKSFRSPWFLEPDKSILAQKIVDCDPLLDQYFPDEAYSLMDKTLDVAQYAPANFIFIFPVGNFCSEAGSKIHTHEFLEETNCRFSVTLGKKLQNKLFYRGQAVNDDKGLPSFYFFDYVIDIYSKNASDWLTFNRNSLSSKGKIEITKLISKNLKLWIEKNLDKIFELESYDYQKATLSAMANTAALDKNNDYQSFWLEIAKQLPNEWKELPCEFIDNNIGSSGILTKDILTEGNLIADGRIYPEKMYPESKRIALLPNIAQIAINDWLKDINNSVSYELIEPTSTHFKYPEIQAAKLIKNEKPENKIKIEPNLLVKLVEKNLKSDFPTRLLLPLDFLPDKFNKTELNLKSNTRVHGAVYVLELMPCPLMHFIVPYLISPKSNKPIKFEKMQFVQWLHDNLENDIDIRTTESNVMKIIDWFENLMKDSKIWQDLEARSDLNVR
ncbi:hypothetical protein HC024_10535 [Methylococcaceae bacterium WWC4]|nr:hypothetical protein [Methylococcaceae bacterium WWC4]